VSRGNALMTLRRIEDALASFDHALAIEPANSDAHRCRADALAELKR
jgi:cytochrome c-type biogenesis protein CcmH/NrfG